jgi:hypothetical protein
MFLWWPQLWWLRRREPAGALTRDMSLTGTMPQVMAMAIVVSPPPCLAAIGLTAASAAFAPAAGAA